MELPRTRALRGEEMIETGTGMAEDPVAADKDAGVAGGNFSHAAG